jgi:hypothetical protein
MRIVTVTRAELDTTLKLPWMNPEWFLTALAYDDYGSHQ